MNQTAYYATELIMCYNLAQGS